MLWIRTRIMLTVLGVLLFCCSCSSNSENPGTSAKPVKTTESLSTTVPVSTENPPTSTSKPSEETKPTSTTTSTVITTSQTRTSTNTPVDVSKPSRTAYYPGSGNTYGPPPKIEPSSVREIIPSDSYQEYPGLHTAPLSATLYKDGQVTEIAIDDPRLIQLMNLFNYSICAGQYYYTTGGYSPDAFTEIASNSFRLEMTFIPDPEAPTMESTFDRIIVVEGLFVGVRSNIPFGSYPVPYSAFGRRPLGEYDVNWLTFFGF